MSVDLKDIQNGVHLFHFDISNCSQRVRICLSEKNITWKSHLVNLVSNEHASPWFQKINPKGLVPVLVDEGLLISESIDIIKYLDTTFPNSTLYPSGSADKIRVDELLEMADEVQGAIKLLTHEFLFKPSRWLMKLSFKKFAAQHGNSELVEFKRRFINDEFTSQEIDAAGQSVLASFSNIDNYLQQSCKVWMSSESFSLADIAWMVNVHRLCLIGFPLNDYPFLARWYLNCKQRNCFQEGLMDYEPWFMKTYARVNTAFNKPKLKRLFEHREILNSAEQKN